MHSIASKILKEMEVSAMSFFNKYTSTISKKIIGREEMWNLCDLVTCIEADKTPPRIEECIITPYYTNESGRYELYKYEFYVEQSDGKTFDEYILTITGKSKVEEVADDVIRIRKICFGRIDENNQSDILNKIIEYFHFLMEDEDIQREIKDVFAEFDVNKIFISIN